jgi:hypothetical protein
MASLHASSFINSNRDVKKHPKPILLPVPWPDKSKESDVSPEEKARLRAVLIKHSAFADRPEEEPP